MELLLVEDDLALVQALARALAARGFALVTCSDGTEALALCRRRRFDAIVLDLSLPGIDGLEVLARLRGREDTTPVLILTARGAVGERVTGLNAGADDYLAKPFLPAELIARVRAVLRRAKTDPAPPDQLQDGAVRMDLAAHRAYVHGQEIELTATEFRILQALLSRPGRLVRRDQMIQAVYGGHHHISQRTLDSHLRGVRARLGPAGDAIETITACGWRWRAGG